MMALAIVGLVLFVGAACGGPARSTTSTNLDTAPPASATTTPTADPATATPAPTPSEIARLPTDPPAIELSVIARGLRAPVDVAVRPGDPDGLYVVEQAGRVVVVRDGTVRPAAFLDIAGQVTAGGEQGLLGLAFHPDAGDDRLFVYYTAVDGSQVVASFQAPTGADAVADPTTETVILRMADRFANHNGGGMAFGPDGTLYVATGDGGGGGDPLGSGRDLSSLLGKILRIDVTASDDIAVPYAIPGDNPYLDDPSARPETWASGLRNPWRIRFDRANGDLWIGDVGQGEWEEVDVARAGIGGLDFGWNVMEGTHCYEPATGCDETGLTLPVSEYDHDLGCSITGGTVYRGTAWPELDGFYVFADYCSGTFWAIPATTEATVAPTVVLESGRSISAIAEDGAGELVATDLSTGELLRVSAPGT